MASSSNTTEESEDFSVGSSSVHFRFKAKYVRILWDRRGNDADGWMLWWRIMAIHAEKTEFPDPTNCNDTKNTKTTLQKRQTNAIVHITYVPRINEMIRVIRASHSQKIFENFCNHMGLTNQRSILERVPIDILFWWPERVGNHSRLFVGLRTALRRFLYLYIYLFQEQSSQKNLVRLRLRYGCV